MYRYDRSSAVFAENGRLRSRYRVKLAETRPTLHKNVVAHRVFEWLYLRAWPQTSALSRGTTCQR